MKATATQHSVVTTFINIDLGYNDEERRTIQNFCQEVVRACHDITIAGQVMTNIALGYPHCVSKEDNYEITIK